MQVEGTYIGWGNVSANFRHPDGSCFKVYRPGVPERKIEKEYELMNLFHAEGLRVPKVHDLLTVGISQESLEGITDEFIREEFENSEGQFLALRKSFIDGTIMGKRWLPSRKIWKSYIELNKGIFSLGYTPYDFIPHNYIVTPDKEVYLIDADKVRKASPNELVGEVRGMKVVPVTHFGRAIFDIKRWIIENTIYKIFGIDTSPGY